MQLVHSRINKPQPEFSHIAILIQTKQEVIKVFLFMQATASLIDNTSNTGKLYRVGSVHGQTAFKNLDFSSKALSLWEN